jgi:hypothetical protein
MPTVIATSTQTSQAKFDGEYITASEMMKLLNISRAGFLYGRRAGKLPEPIVLNEGRLLVWKRQEAMPLLEIWREAITTRKSA